jgi:hypothetical protein
MDAKTLRMWGALATAGALAGCGGGGDDDGGGGAQPASVACAVDTAVALAYEEQRLGTPLPTTGANVIGTDPTPVSERILKDTGFDGFAPAFAARLCTGGTTTVSTYELALDAVKAEGALLWRAAVDRVQGRRASPAGSRLPASDDRMLYWARVAMTKALRQWNPSFAMTAVQREELQWQFERASRGQYDIAFPTGTNAAGKPYRRMVVSGFDMFTLGIPGTPNTGLRNGNPSGATALHVDGKEYTLADGSTLRIESYVLPVSYDPFNKGMQEDTLGPWFRSGPQRVDASITMSQGGANIFWLEQWNARFHGPSAGNDGIIYCPTGATRLPSYVLPIGTVSGTAGAGPITLANSGCDVYPPARWLGYESGGTWQKDFPRQYTDSSLPIPEMVLGRTNVGVPRPPGVTSLGTDGFDVTWHTNYTYFEDCNLLPTIVVPSNNISNGLPDISTVKAPSDAWCSRAGGGGDYLSNESAYRNTLLRDVFGLGIPAGHIHVPVMNNYFNGTAAAGGQPRDDNAVSDARFEAYRTAIVAQGEKLLLVVGNSLTLRAD